MITRQLTLLDKIALENGSRSLSALKFEEASGYFNNALEPGTGNKESIRRVVDACRYWDEQLMKFNKSDSTATEFSGLPVAFITFIFTGEIDGMK